MPELTLDWKKYKDAAVDIAREGAVLIKNDNNALPVSADAGIALFGRMQGNYYKSGTGSGGMVNVNHVYDIREGLKEAGANGEPRRSRCWLGSGEMVPGRDACRRRARQ